MESDGEDDVVPEGKRVIGSVGGVEALSTGYIDCTPAEMLIDSGAIASLIHVRVLKRIGRADEPLRPYRGSLNGVTGHKLVAKGVIDVPMRLGSQEKLRPFVVVNRLHVDDILGTDTLKAYRAVVDLDDNTLILKDMGEVIPLGSPRVEETYRSKMGSTVRLRPGGQALVVTDVLGSVAENLTVLVEGLPDLDATVKGARTLCTVHDGKVLVEVCNASTEDVVIRKGTTVASATIIPETAFELGRPSCLDDTGPSEGASGTLSGTSWIDPIIGATTDETSGREPIPELEKVLREELEVDFTGSKLSQEQQQLMRGLLDQFRDMFVDDPWAYGPAGVLNRHWNASPNQATTVPSL